VSRSHPKRVWSLFTKKKRDIFVLSVSWFNNNKYAIISKFRYNLAADMNRKQTKTDDLYHNLAEAPPIHSSLFRFQCKQHVNFEGNIFLPFWKLNDFTCIVTRRVIQVIQDI
jgi:hypothetical protein